MQKMDRLSFNSVGSGRCSCGERGGPFRESSGSGADDGFFAGGGKGNANRARSALGFIGRFFGRVLRRGRGRTMLISLDFAGHKTVGRVWAWEKEQRLHG